MKYTNGGTQTEPTTTTTGQELISVQSLDLDQKKWVEKLCKARQVGVRAILDIGQKLIDAKAELDHGRWLPVLKAAGYSERMAELFMKVARHTVLSDLKNIASLPPSISTLAALADFNSETLTGHIKSGDVSPQTTRAAVKTMKPKKDKKKPVVVFPALDQSFVEHVVPLLDYTSRGSTEDVLITAHYLLGELAEILGERGDTKEADVLSRARDVIGSAVLRKAAKSKVAAEKLRAQAERRSAKSKKTKVEVAVADLMAAQSMAEDLPGLSVA